MSATSPAIPLRSEESYGFLDGRYFDLTLILGTAVLALGSGVIVHLAPHLFVWVLMADLWFLGYHHVISTFTRLSFDKEAFHQHRHLVLVLPWVVLGLTVLTAWITGTWLIATIYLYWQWFHYMRQSYGVSRAYSRKAEVSDTEGRVITWMLYLVATFGICYRSLQGETLFLGMDVRMAPQLLHDFLGMPLSAARSAVTALMWGSGILSVGVIGWWIALQFTRPEQSAKQTALSLYTFSHILIFLSGYCFLTNIDHGWLILNVWHNAQYILFVWWFNTRRFRNQQDPPPNLLAWMSGRSLKSVAAYFGICLGLSTVVYLVLLRVLNLGFFATIPAASLVTYQAINFHHYVVDGMIWKSKRKKAAPAVA